jgi:hypothetical protein
MSRKPKKHAARWTPGLKMLKAISIRQPWAWLIRLGILPIQFQRFSFPNFSFCPSGPFGWVLANARRLPFKPCRGQFKFFTRDI